MQVMPLAAAGGGGQGGGREAVSQVAGPESKRIGFIDQSQHLEWEANAVPPELSLRRLRLRSCFVPRFHCHPMEERNQCTHFPFDK